MFLLVRTGTVRVTLLPRYRCANAEIVLVSELQEIKLSNIVGWASRPPYGLGLGWRDAHPTRVNWIFFYLEVPKSRRKASMFV